MQSLPSPVSSPATTPQDSTTSSNSGPGSRKRQRSQSMQSSGSSSSVKRSASEDPSHSATEQTTPAEDSQKTVLDENAADIDAYMAEQDEGEPSTSMVAPAAPSPPVVVTAATQDPMQRYECVECLRKEPMQVGQTWYLVSRAWYTRWASSCKGEVDKQSGGPLDQQSVGPVDNSRLMDDFGHLSESIREGEDVEFVPQKVWHQLWAWYGRPKAAHAISRKVIARGRAQEPTIELHPIRLRVLIMQSRIHSTSSCLTGRIPSLQVSCTDTVSAMVSKAVSLLRPHITNADSPHHIWTIQGSNFENAPKNDDFYPLSRLAEDRATALPTDDPERKLEDALIESGDIVLVYFGEKNIDPEEARNWDSSSALFAPPQTQSGVPPPMFSSESNFFNRMQGSTAVVQPTPTQAEGSGWGTGATTSSFTLKPAAPITVPSNARPRNRQAPGTVGLGNLGNTCFMNSALQCLAHNKELTEYFMTQVYEDELNPDNPLGMGGAIATAYGSLLSRLWDADTALSSYSPREFKSALQRFAPQFSGYAQHDSQELVAFLLDGLHEDLNRVRQKPYVENPEWAGGGDREMVDLARRAWEGYKRRNDSVIVDLFQGQYQSTLVCPECQKVSITFDPFMYLTLPLPIQKKWRHTVFYIPWDPEKPHVKVPVEIGRDASFKDLRALLGRWMEAPAENLLTLEIFNHRFYKVLDDTLLCGEMAENDVILCFELPCVAFPPKGERPENAPFVLPLYLCDTGARTTAMKSLFGYPSIVVITQEQAQSEEGIYVAVVDRLQRWTVNARDLYRWEAGSSAVSIDEVPIRLGGQDALTEIKENGDVVTHEAVPEEGDIADEKSIVQEEDGAVDAVMDQDAEPHKVGIKPDLFSLRAQGGQKNYGTNMGFSYGSSMGNFENWEDRKAEGKGILLRPDDALVCGFDEPMKAYYFGDERTKWEHARWDAWTEFVHPEYEAGRRAVEERKSRGISLADCMDEFTREEQLGADDLWYCPQCKKHQQATKKFDLWKAPDVLVVHLKRFSNSRALRDKIDAFVDFPVEGLDLEDWVGQRKVSKRLLASGAAVDDLELPDVDEPLVYDLFGVDEHLGGLGGGHYRAYALNHVTEKWYHFDDSYVSEARASDAVNANAYLLFYRRRTTRPLGGTTYEKVEQAKAHPKASSSPVVENALTTITTQLPTPPNEAEDSFLGLGRDLRGLSETASPLRGLTIFGDDGMITPKSSPGSGSLPALDVGDDPPSFDSMHMDEVLESSHHYDFPNPSTKASPSSSNEAESGDDGWRRGEESFFSSGDRSPVPASDNGQRYSPSVSTISDDPFQDTTQRRDNQSSPVVRSRNISPASLDGRVRSPADVDM